MPWYILAWSCGTLPSQLNPNYQQRRPVPGSAYLALWDKGDFLCKANIIGHESHQMQQF